MKHLIVIALMIIFGGCGSTPPEATPFVPTSSVTGKAVAGAVTSAAVSLKDRENSEVSTVTGSDGSYSIDTTGLKKPYLMKAVFTNASTLYAIVPDNGTANINGTTDRLANLAAAGLRLAEVYLDIKGELLIMLANIAGSIADSMAR